MNKLNELFKAVKSTYESILYFVGVSAHLKYKHGSDPLLLNPRYLIHLSNSFKNTIAACLVPYKAFNNHNTTYLEYLHSNPCGTLRCILSFSL